MSDGVETVRVGRGQRVAEQRLFNPLLRWLLRSPLHPLADRWVLLVSYEGRHSGTRYTFPVVYLEHGGDLFAATPSHESTWWRTFTAPYGCAVWLRGRRVPVTGEVLDGEERAAALRAYGERYPRLSRSLGVADTPLEREESVAVVRFRPDG